MTVYLMFFVLSPFINKVLESISTKDELFLILVLVVISIYIGGFQKFEAYSTGKNVLNFIMVYAIGDLFHKSEEKCERTPTWSLIIAFFALNLIEMFSYDFIPSSHIQVAIWKISFPYNCPLLIINAVLLFVVFSRINITSKWINWTAGSCLGIYMLHHHPVIDEKLSALSKSIIESYSQNITILLFVVLTSVIVIFCTIIDIIVEYPIGKLFTKKKTNVNN